MKRATRNRILVWVIFLGLLNFAVYTFAYWCLQGDARNGCIRFGTADGSSSPEYVLRGHFLRARAGRESAAVSRAVWIYSFVHSISIWPTIGAILVSMFILARPHIIATIKSDSVVSGRAIVNGCIVLVLLVTLLGTLVFFIDLIEALAAAANGQNYGV